MGEQQQPEDMSELDCLRELVTHARHMRALLATYEPLLSAVKPNGRVNYVRAAGLRRAMRGGADAVP